MTSRHVPARVAAAMLLGAALAPLATACLPTLRPEGAPAEDDDWDLPVDAGPQAPRDGAAPAQDAGASVDAGGVVADGGPATPDAGWLPDLPPRTGAFRHRRAEGSATIQTRVDATSYEEWRRLDLDTALAVDDAESPAWDLAFKRFFVVTNGGVSGPGTGAARAVDVAFDALEVAPSDGYLVDAPDIEEDDDTGPETAFNGGPGGERDWYDYALATHTLTSRGRTYVVRTSEGAFVKLRILSYYDGAGSPGVLTFEWARIAPPPPSTALRRAPGRD
jgi:hypothetical protein